MAEFDPSITQKIVKPEAHAQIDFLTMTKWQLVKMVFVEVHKHILTWYSYLVGLSIILQESWKEFEEYVPVAWRHTILIVVTVLVVIDKVVVAGREIKARFLSPDGV